MANRYWVASSSGNWSDTANWSDTDGGYGGFSIPSSSDATYFTSGGLGDCGLITDASCSLLSIASAYTGHLDANGYNFDIVGNLVDRGRVSYGSGTWNIGGTFYLRGGPNTNLESAIMNISGSFDTEGGTNYWNPGTSILTIAGNINFYNRFPLSSSAWHIIHIGSGVNCQGRRFGGYTVAEGAYVNNARSMAGSPLNVSGILNLNGRSAGANPFNLFTNGKLINLGSSANISLGWSSYVDQVREINISGIIENLDKITFKGLGRNAKNTLSINVIESQYLPSLRFGDTNSAGGDVPKLNFVNDNTFISGDFTINNSAGSFTFSPSGNIICLGDINFNTSNLIYNRNNQQVVLSGSNSQLINTDNEHIDKILINKSAGSVTLTSNLTTDSLTLTDGTVDISGYDLTTTGNFTQGVATIVQDSNGSGLITVGGDFRINGSNDSPTIWNDADLNISGSALATNITVSGSNASSGTYVTASRNSIDNGDNLGWTFRNAQSNIYKKLRLNSDSKLTIKGN